MPNAKKKRVSEADIKKLAKKYGELLEFVDETLQMTLGEAGPDVDKQIASFYKADKLAQRIADS